MLQGLIRWDMLLTDWSFFRWFLIFSISLLFLTYPIKAKSTVLWFYLLVLFGGTIYNFYFGTAPFPHLHKFRMRGEMLYWTLAHVLGVCILYQGHRVDWKRLLTWVFYTNAAMTIIFPGKGIIYYNTSLNSTLMVSLLAFALAYDRGPFWKVFDVALMLVCLILSNSAIGAFAFLGGLFWYALVIFNWKGRLVVFALLLFTFLVFYLDQGRYLFSISGRGPMWTQTINIIKALPIKYKLLGIGQGSYSYIGMIYQGMAKVQEGGKVYNIQLHNDMLQMVLEAGFAGFIAWAMLMLDLLIKAIKRKMYWAVYFTAAWVVSSFGNFPGHISVDFFIFYIVLYYVYFNFKETNSIPLRGST